MTEPEITPDEARSGATPFAEAPSGAASSGANTPDTTPSGHAVARANRPLTIAAVVMVLVVSVVSALFGAFGAWALPLYCHVQDCATAIVAPTILLVAVPLVVGVVTAVVSLVLLRRGRTSFGWALAGLVLVLISSIIGAALAVQVR